MANYLNKGMKSIFAVVIIVIAAVLFGCKDTDPSNAKEKLTGLWSLHIMEQQNHETGEWSEWRSGTQGYLLYDGIDGMALHLTIDNYHDFDLVFPNFNDSIPLGALKHLTNSYVYFARYTVDEEKGIVEHARISHSNPADWNKIVRRKYSFSGDTLLLEPVEQGLSNLRLKWLRLN